jgi:VanZ family protein
MAAVIRWLAVALWMGLIFVISSIPSLHGSANPSADFMLKKVAHVGEYAVLTTLLWWALQIYGGSRNQAWMLAAVVSTLYAISDEWHQTWVVGRYGSTRDVGYDALGVALSYALTLRPWSRATEGIEDKASRALCPACQGSRVSGARRRGPLAWLSHLMWLVSFPCDTRDHRRWRFTRRGR